MDYLLGFLNLVIVILTLFLIILILIQRGKGGGLAGAFGGMGGSSAFGARTGDVFTKVTVGVAIAWILLSMLMVVLTNRKPASDWTDSAVVTSKDSGPASGSSKIQVERFDRHKPLAPKLPNSTGTELPADVKALSELPDPLECTDHPTQEELTVRRGLGISRTFLWAGRCGPFGQNLAGVTDTGRLRSIARMCRSIDGQDRHLML